MAPVFSSSARSTTTDVGAAQVSAGSSSSTWRSWAAAGAVLIAAPIIIVTASAAVQALDIGLKRWKLRHIPGPPPTLLLGNLPEIIKAGGSHQAIYKWSKQYGPTFKYFILSLPFVVFTDADVNRQITVKLVNHVFFVNKAIRRMNGRNTLLDEQGLLQARDSFWRLLRNAWQPAFAPGTLTRYYSIMTATADELVTHIDRLLATSTGNDASTSAATATTTTSTSAATTSTSAATTSAAALEGDGGGQTPAPSLPATGEDADVFVDIHDVLNKMTLEVVGKSAYGVRFHALADPGTLPPDAPGPALSMACKDMFATISLQGGSKWGLLVAILPPLGPLLVPLALAFPDGPLIRIRKSRQMIMETSAKLISAFRSKLQATNAAAAADGTSGASTAESATPPPGGKLQVEVDSGAQPAKHAPAGKLSGVEPGSFLALMVEADNRARSLTSPRTPPAAAAASSSSFTASLTSSSFTAAARAGPESSLGSSGSLPAAASPAGSFSAAGGGGQQAQPFVMTDLTMIAQANTFILAGTETTANTLAFAIYHIGKHPEVEARLVQELQAHGPPGTPVLIDDKFPYVDAIISETLRLTPPAHATSRDMDKRGGLEIAGVHIPYMTPLLVPIYSLHRMPEYWARPEEFLPERWLPENLAELGPRNPNAYLPFGAGTRMCPGYKFALQEARIALVTLYKQYSFRLHPDLLSKPLRISAGITLSPRQGVQVKVLPRTGTSLSG